MVVGFLVASQLTEYQVQILGVRHAASRQREWSWSTMLLHVDLVVHERRTGDGQHLEARVHSQENEKTVYVRQGLTCYSIPPLAVVLLLLSLSLRCGISSGTTMQSFRCGASRDRKLENTVECNRGNKNDEHDTERHCVVIHVRPPYLMYCTVLDIGRTVVRYVKCGNFILFFWLGEYIRKVRRTTL